MKSTRSDVFVFPPLKKLVLLFAIAAALSLDVSAAVLYVDKGNISTQDGLSWPTAYTTIQPGIDAVYDDGGGGEVLFPLCTRRYVGRNRLFRFEKVIRIRKQWMRHYYYYPFVVT